MSMQRTFSIVIYCHMSTVYGWLDSVPTRYAEMLVIVCGRSGALFPFQARPKELKVTFI